MANFMFFALPYLKWVGPPKVEPTLSPPPTNISRGKVSWGYNPWRQRFTANTLNFKPIFDPFVKNTGGSLSWPFSSTCKIWGCSIPYRLNMVFRKSWFGWVWFDLQISKVTGPKFTTFFSPNAGEIAVDQLLVWFWILSEIMPNFGCFGP